MTFAIKDIKKTYLEQIEKIALSNGKSEREIVNNIFKKALENENDKLEGIPENILNAMVNKDTYNPSNPDSIVGIADAPEGFDAVRAVNDARIGKWE